MPKKSSPKIIFDSDAAKEFRQARRWYLREAGSDVSNRFVDEIDDALSRIKSMPSSLPLYPKENCRWLKLDGFPYLIIYEILDAQSLLVLAVAHERRTPGYWRTRQRNP
ncbi:type II toxin-antitoxin system RelE/ParE family toxin [Lacunimicrobium album]